MIVVRGEINPNSQDCSLVSLQLGELLPQILMSNMCYETFHFIFDFAFSNKRGLKHFSQMPRRKLCRTTIKRPLSRKPPQGQCCPAWPSCAAWWRPDGRRGRCRTVATCTCHQGWRFDADGEDCQFSLVSKLPVWLSRIESLDKVRLAGDHLSQVDKAGGEIVVRFPNPP